MRGMEVTPALNFGQVGVGENNIKATVLGL